MIKIYNTDLETNIFSEIKEYKKGSWINLVNPSEKEIQEVCENIKIKEDFIKYSLDNEEKSRIEVEEEDNTTFIIIDVPIIEVENGEEIHTTMPLGMIVARDDFFITVSLNSIPIISQMENNKKIITYKKSRMILQIFYKNSETFLRELKKIDKEKEVAEKALNNSMKNKELLKMLSLEKSLVYITTSLKANELVMEKTMRGKIIKLYQDDEDILEDAIIENRQAMEMSKIYSDILSGTMDAYASIISNNLNIVMKVLTSITIILSVPTIIGSFWGMNVHVPMEESPFGFYIVMGLAVIISVALLFWFRKKDMLS